MNQKRGDEPRREAETEAANAFLTSLSWQAVDLVNNKKAIWGNLSSTLIAHSSVPSAQVRHSPLLPPLHSFGKCVFSEDFSSSLFLGRVSFVFDQVRHCWFEHLGRICVHLLLCSLGRIPRYIKLAVRRGSSSFLTSAKGSTPKDPQSGNTFVNNMFLFDNPEKCVRTLFVSYTASFPSFLFLFFFASSCCLLLAPFWFFFLLLLLLLASSCFF